MKKSALSMSGPRDTLRRVIESPYKGATGFRRVVGAAWKSFESCASCGEGIDHVTNPSRGSPRTVTTGAYPPRGMNHSLSRINAAPAQPEKRPRRPLRVAMITETYPPEVNGVARTV